MNYNSGNARRNFYAKWVKLREEYQAAGMKEDAIQKMYEYDLAVFNDDRAHHRYDVEIPNGRNTFFPSTWLTTAKAARTLCR